jgi:hypothetical protein
MRTLILVTLGLLAATVRGQEIVEVPPVPGDLEFVIVDLAEGGSAVLGNSWNGTPGGGETPALWNARFGTRPLPEVFGRAALSASAVSADGVTVVGTAIHPATGHLVAVRWVRDVEITIIEPPSGYTDIMAFDTNDDGTFIVGRVQLQDGSSRGYVWTEGAGVRALPHPAGFDHSLALAVDADGNHIVGFSQASDGTAVPCLWNADRGLEVLPRPAGVPYAIAQDVSRDGSRVIGSFIDGAATYFAYVWDRDGGLMDLGLQGDSTGVTSIGGDGRMVAWDDGYENRVFDDTLGLIDVRLYLGARGLARRLPEHLGISHIAPDGSALGVAYLEGGDGRRVSALITNFTLPTTCPPDIDLNERLDTFDFLAFTNRFHAGDPRADLDGDGVLTIADFLAFQVEFEAGC